MGELGRFLVGHVGVSERMMPVWKDNPSSLGNKILDNFFNVNLSVKAIVGLTKPLNRSSMVCNIRLLL